MKTCGVGQIGVSDQGPDTDHMDYICVFIVAPGYDHFLTRKHLRLPLIIQLVIPFRLTVGKHELCAVGPNTREDAVFLGFDCVDVVFFRTDAVGDLTDENLAGV